MPRTPRAWLAWLGRRIEDQTLGHVIADRHPQNRFHHPALCLLRPLVLHALAALRGGFQMPGEIVLHVRITLSIVKVGIPAHALGQANFVLL